MEPRLKSSTQWTPFPAELCQLTSEVLSERFKDEYDIEESKFVVEGRIYKEEILGRFGLHSIGQLKQQNFEFSLEFNPKKEKALEKIQELMDVVDHLWKELLEEDLEDDELSKDWQTLPYEKKMYYYRYSTVNTHLEEEADRLLADMDKKLVYESEDHESVTTSNEEPDSTLH